MGLGKKLKKIVKKATNVLDPFGLVHSKPGPDNPYAPPNVDYLRQPDPYITNLTNNYRGSADFLKQSDPYFEQLVANINAPSSVDEVTRRVENDNFNRTMGQINRDVRSNADSALSYFADRGLVGPGQSSDIASEGVGVAYGRGSEAAAGARGQLYMGELGRQQAREKALMDAYGARYDTSAKGALSDVGYYNGLLGDQAKLSTSRDLGYGEILSSLYSDAEKRRQEGKKNPIAEDLLRNSRISFGFGG